MDVETRWLKTIVWGSLTALAYAVLFFYSDLLMQMAHTTPAACVAGSVDSPVYYHGANAAACARLGGHVEPGNGLLVLVPIAIALIISFVHGAFTGLFWDVMGLKPAGQRPH